MWLPPRVSKVLIVALLAVVLNVICAANFSEAQLAGESSSSAWLLPRTERSPLQRVVVWSPKHASQLFNGRANNNNNNEQLLQKDFFSCVNPTRELFDRFVMLYNRTSLNRDSSEKLERLNLFVTTMRRTIMINRIIQNDILNETNYDLKPDIRNYYFISPLDELALWYADITDCELGLIKYILFDIFYLIDKNELAMAYKVALDNSEYLPLLDEDGFEQLANILLVRLYDRFKGDEKMNQLFQWPLYVKKLSAYAYNRRQISQPNFNSKLALISYAYPSYFKDLKYNSLAVNRTGDNWKAHLDHEKFNKLLNRKFSSRQERNRRLAIFRQRWTLVNTLNDNKRWQNITLLPDWLRVQQANTVHYSTSAKLIDQDDPNAYNYQDQFLQAQQPQQIGGGIRSINFLGNDGRFKHTQFSDLTDAEFVAFLTNDFSLLENNKDSAEFIDANFPIRPLDAKFRAEIAVELEQRRTIQPPTVNANDGDDSGQQQQARSQMLRAANLGLADEVVNELISDVGLPIGSVMVEGISEEEHYRMFNKVSQFFAKTYSNRANSAAALNAKLQNQQSELFIGQPNDSELADERQRRYEQFKSNYGRFRAWFIKDGWTIDETQLVAMLRLADSSWAEIKLTLFKVCCLTDENLASLGATNATLQYFGSNEFLCQQFSNSHANDSYHSNAAVSEKLLDPLHIIDQSQQYRQQQQQQQREQNRRLRDLAALELYYYYSVHFNKHHLDMDSFNKRFAIFRHNIDQIRRHSCTRGLTLYRSLKTKRFESLNNIDVLDPRRSYTDDINLDRYRYFTIPNLNLDPKQQHQLDQQFDDSELGFDRLREYEPEFTTARTSSSETLTRAGFSHRGKPFFSSLLERPETRASQQPKPPGTSYADKLVDVAQNYNLNTRKYRKNSVGRIYDLVMQRYRYCMRTVKNIELGEVRQQCQSSGPLGDQAAQLVWGSNLSDNRLNSRLTQEDPCAFYRLGLEPWAEGLIKQDLLSAQLIQNARC